MIGGKRLRQAALYGGLFIAAAMIAASGEAAAMETKAHVASHHHHHYRHHHRHLARHHVHPAKPRHTAKPRTRPHANAAAASSPAASPGPAAADPAKSSTGAIGSGGGGGGSGGAGGSGAGGSGAGGSGGGGSGGGSWSDRRLKRDIRRIGTSPSGLGIYAFRYIWGGPVFVGVMAQDLLESRPDAVIETESGFLMVDYDKIDVRMTTLDDYLAALAV